MVRSMTGYGHAQATLHGRDISVEIRSVNHKYFDFSVRTPRGYSFVEDKVRSFVKERVSRGKIDVYITILTVDETAAQVILNKSLAEGYIKALHELGTEFGLKDDISVSSVARCSDIFTVKRAEQDEDEIWNDLSGVLSEAVEHFIAMREAEGLKLLRAKIEELLGDASVDEQRLLTETAIFADKIAVDEETVRLRSHFEQMDKMLHSGEAVGRKLDFIVQEMNREANTIGSKCQNSDVAHLVVEIKAEIEKIREQIQNIE